MAGRDLTADFIANLRSNASDLAKAMTGPAVSNITISLFSKEIFERDEQEPVKARLDSKGPTAAAQDLISDVLTKCNTLNRETKSKVVNGFLEALRTSGMDSWERTLRRSESETRRKRETPIGDAGAMSLESSAKTQCTSDVAADSRCLYLAVRPLMSTSGAHLEVQVQCGSNATQLNGWVASSNETYPPNIDWLIPLNEAAAPSRLVALLDSETKDGDGYHHGCKPVMQPSSAQQAWAWIFDLDGAKISSHRSFKFQLFNKDLSELHHCGTKEFPDFSGCSQLSSLGFAGACVMPSTSTPTPAKFARSPELGGVYLASVVEQIVTIGKSVGLIFAEGTKKRLLGTGFIVGNENEKFVMTCHHVWKLANDYRKVCITFADNLTNSTGNDVITIKGSKFTDEDLDLAILTVDQTCELPKPLNCCKFDFEDELYDKRPESRFFTLIGYPQETEDSRSIDFIANWSQPNKTAVDGAKNEVQRLWATHPHCKEFLKEYDDILDTKNALFYNIAHHRHGSSGSPVLYCKEGHGLYIVAMHRQGLPGFYYQSRDKAGKLDEAERMKLDLNFTVEAGTRMSKIFEVLEQNDGFQGQIFRNNGTAFIDIQ